MVDLLISGDLSSGHDDPDLPVDHDLFTDTPTEHQHGFPP
jgi:hypothetical protein